MAVIVTITFHGPFRVVTADGRPGINDAVDPDELLPASALKGVMRQAADVLFPQQTTLTEAVFGTPRTASPWAWGPVEFATTPCISVRARGSIDPETGTAKDDHLMFADEVWATTASFEISRTAYLERDTTGRHEALLVCASAGVHALGADRRRGLGWVTLTPSVPVTEDLLDLLGVPV
ncbi:RAMP superfamily CRISPR-associated protein [Promicromonospora sp. NPDC057138]|uniref:RAMP superfamily CRISPR-associated protein n=1 Tax=Promicromonospora sp. NPDC057138 TaxID=3346031 RepID=UPI00362E5BB4